MRSQHLTKTASCKTPSSPPLPSARHQARNIGCNRADFVRTARAKGLHERRGILVHVVKNAMIPVLTIVGPLFAGIGTGSFFVETIFRVTGLGRFFAESMTGRDDPMIMAVGSFYAEYCSVL